MSASSTSSDEMSSGSSAASRARELLAAKDSESLLNFKLRSASPIVSNNSTHDPKHPRRTTGQISVRVETLGESSTRVREILSSMKQKRETFTSTVQDSKSLVRKSEERSEQTHNSGKPPLSLATGREDLTKKMSESLKDKRNRITKLLSADHQKQRLSSRSPHTVDTATTADSTTEDSQSIGSWAVDRPSPHSMIIESTKSPVPLHEIEEAFESDDSSMDEGIGGDSTGRTDGPMRRQPKSLSDSFTPIDSDESGIEHFTSTESPDEDCFASADESDPSSRSQGDKKVSFDDTPVVIEEMVPPSIVHCCSTSFETQFSKEGFTSRYAPDDSSYSAGATETQNLRKTSSWDGSDPDTSEAKKGRFSALVQDREKRVMLMRKLEQTYSELLGLHHEIESTRIHRIPSRDDSSDSSVDMLENDEESSADFTNDSNTSGWISRDESNSRLDSLLQYMTSEDDDSFEESLTSQERFSISLSQTASNLDTLMESDETEEIDESAEVDRSVHESEGSRAGEAAQEPTDMNPRGYASDDYDVTPRDSSARLKKNSGIAPKGKEDELGLETADSTGVSPSEVRDESVADTDTAVWESLDKDKDDYKLCPSDDRTHAIDETLGVFEIIEEQKNTEEAFARKNGIRELKEHEKDAVSTYNISKVDSNTDVHIDGSKFDRNLTDKLSSDKMNSTKGVAKNPRIDSEDSGNDKDCKTKESIPKDPSTDSGGDKSSTKGEKITKTILKDPSTDSDDTMKDSSSTKGEKIKKTIPKDPSTDSEDTGEDRSRCSTKGEKITKTIPKDPSTDSDDTRGDRNRSRTKGEKITKTIPKDPSTDTDDTNGNRSRSSTKGKKITKKPSVDSKESKRSNQSKRKAKVAKKPSLRAKGDPRVINQVIVLRKRSPKGIVKREIDRWESAQGNPKDTVEKPKRPDPPMGEVSFLIEPNIEEMTEDEHEGTDFTYIDEQAGVRKDPEAEICDAQQYAETAETEDRTIEQRNTDKVRKKYLFVPRKVSNIRCRASGGLLDLAKRTGISDSSTICVKTLDIPRPPEVTAINAEFACGTQGSLYNLALRSGCEIEQRAEPKRLKLPPLGGGKKRWLLKARGGHYHISVWTTISNAVLTARVGFSTHGNAKELKSAILEKRTDECGARGLRHIAEMTDWL
uniref:Uncharacterized protein n=1 Tax=Amphora coffeiformis TaxID=265554 RepID=A0A7S3L341_9STRA